MTQFACLSHCWRPWAWQATLLAGVARRLRWSLAWSWKTLTPPLGRPVDLTELMMIWGALPLPRFFRVIA
jgi:hypothetical protein